MKKKASDLKKGDKIKILDKIWTVNDLEVSDLGKQGSKKCRLELYSGKDKISIIRPSEYPFEVI